MLNLREIIQRKKVFLWDFDGCFCDSEPIHFQAYEKAFATFGHNIRYEEYFETFTQTGGGIKKEIENHNLNCDPKEIRKLKDEFYMELIQSGKAKLFPEIPKILSCLHKLNIRSVIASNSSKHEIEVILSHLNEKIHLENIFGLIPGLRKKPFPDIFNHALAELKINPQDAMVVEDSERGLLAAKAAYCEALWVRTYLTEQFESKAPYLAKISHQEILDILG